MQWPQNWPGVDKRMNVVMQYFAPKGENSIVWLEDPENFKFVRVRLFVSITRTKKPGKLKIGSTSILIGYSTIEKSFTDRYYKNYGFLRRLFYVTDQDIKPDCNYLIKKCMPSGAVNPKTVSPGIYGEQTYD